MTQNTIDTILEDPELVRTLNVIEKTSTGSSNAYASRQATLEFCRMMWKLSRQEGTNPFKEMQLLYEILSSEEFISLVKKQEISETKQTEDGDRTLNDEDDRVNVIDLGCGNGDKARMIVGNLPFSFITYLPIDISPYMSAVALNNLQTILNQDVVSVNVASSLDIRASDIDRLMNRPKDERIQRLRSILDKYALIQTEFQKFWPSLRYHSFAQYSNKRSQFLQQITGNNDPNTIFVPEKLKDQIKREKGKSYVIITESDSEDCDYLSSFLMSKSLGSRIMELFDFINLRRTRIESIINESDDDKITALERYFDIFDPLLDYYVDYSREFVSLVLRGEFSKAVKLFPYAHLDIFNKTFLLGDPSEDKALIRYPNWFTTTANLDDLKYLINARNAVKAQPQPQDSMFGAQSLEKLLDNCIGAAYFNCFDAWDKDRVCFVPESGITLDFFDFDKVYKSIAYLTSINPGRNLFLLLGQTLGNFNLEERRLLLSNIYAKLKPNDLLFVGVDLCPDQILTPEAKQFRIDRIKAEYKEGEPFARSCLRTDQTNIKYIVNFDEKTNDVVIDLEDTGVRKTFFRSHKFSYQEIQDILTSTGFKLIGGRAYIPQTKIDYGKEYAVILCQKVEK